MDTVLNVYSETPLSIFARYALPTALTFFVQARFIRSADAELSIRRWLMLVGGIVLISGTTTLLLHPVLHQSSGVRLYAVSLASATFWGGFGGLLCVILALGGDTAFSQRIRRMLRLNTRGR